MGKFNKEEKDSKPAFNSLCKKSIFKIERKA